MTSISATRFKAECLGLMERVRRTGKPVLITKRGRVVAPSRPWRRMRGSVAHMGDVVSPVVGEDEIAALR